MTQSQKSEIENILLLKPTDEQKLFIDDYVDVRQKLTDTDNEGNNILHLAAENSNLEIFDYILQKDSADLLFEEINSKGMDPVSCAIAFGNDLEIVKKYTDGFGEDDFLDENGNTPLHLAAGYNGNSKFTEYLLSTGYNIHHANNQGLTPVELALEHQENPRVIDLVLEAERTNVVERVIKNRNPVVLYSLKNRGYDMNAELLEGKRPVHLAAMENPDINFFFTLVNLGGVIDAKDWNGRTILHYAAKNKDKRLYNYLTSEEFINLRKELNLDCEDLFGKTPEYYLHNETYFSF